MAILPVCCKWIFSYFRVEVCREQGGAAARVEAEVLEPL